MKSKIIWLIMCAFALSIFGPSCQKEKKTISGQEINSAKKLYESQVNQKTIAARKTFQSNKLDWEGSVISNGKFIITPVLGIKKGITEKYLISNLDEKGENKSQEYLVIFNKEKSARETLIDITSDFLLGLNPKSFSGSVIELSIENKVMRTKKYGTGSGMAIKIGSSEPKGTDLTPDLPMPPCDPGNTITIDWYLQTFVDGELYSEIYLFSTTYCNQSGGGNYNPNYSTAEELADDILNTTLNNIAPASHVTTASIESETSTNRVALYTWKAFVNSTYVVNSIEKGTQKKVFKSGHYEWQWDTFDHIGSNMDGTTLGYTASYNIDYAIPVVGTYTTTMSIGATFTHTSSVLGQSFSRIKALSTNHIFNVNDQPFVNLE